MASTQVLHWDSSRTPRVAFVVPLRIDTVHNNSRRVARLLWRLTGRDVEFHVYINVQLAQHHLLLAITCIQGSYYIPIDVDFPVTPLKAIGITYDDRLHQPSCCWGNHASWPLQGNCVQWNVFLFGVVLNELLSAQDFSTNHCFYMTRIQTIVLSETFAA